MGSSNNQDDGTDTAVTTAGDAANIASPAQEQRMKAIVRDQYGTPDVLELQEIDRPAVGDDDVLVRVHSSCVNPMEWHLMTGSPYLARMTGGLRKPKSGRLGADLAGTVAAVGGNVTQFQPGDEVFGASNGAYAEYVRVSVGAIEPKPSNVSFEEAGTVAIAAFTALQALRDKGELEPGQKVLINGASGGVGTFAVQIAKALGAHVTAVCSSRNVEMVRSIGADHVIDYTEEDFVSSDERYDVFLDTVGNRSVMDSRRVLQPAGIYISIGGPKTSLGLLGRMFSIMAVSLVGKRTMRVMLARNNKEDLVVLRELLESGKVTPVIDRRYELSEVPDALRYQGEGHAQGKTVITVYAPDAGEL